MAIGARNVRLLIAALAITALGGFVLGSAWPRDQVATSGMPLVVSDLAQRYKSRHFFVPKTFPANRTHERTFEAEYAFCFFQGFVYPIGQWRSSKEDVCDNAVVAANVYRAEHPAETDAIMRGYGYKRITVNGIWTQSFEQSDFVPDHDPKQKWWVNGFRSFATYESSASGLTRSQGGAHVQLVGYLSPDGSYGHLGGWNRQVLVFSMKTT